MRKNYCDYATVTSTEGMMTLHFCITPVEGAECMLNKTSRTANLHFLFMFQVSILVEIEVYLRNRKPHLKSQHGFYIV